jgi:hypothetical protein
VHRCPIAPQHGLRLPVDANHLVMAERGASKRCQPLQVDMHVGMAVVAGHIAGQHARVRRVRVGADQRQPRIRQRLQAPTAQHADVAVTTADKHHTPRGHANCQGLKTRSAM